MVQENSNVAHRVMNKKARLGPENPIKPFISPISYHHWQIDDLGCVIPKELVIALGQMSMFVNGYFAWTAADLNEAADHFKYLLKTYTLPEGYYFAAGDLESFSNFALRIGTIKVPGTQIHLYILKI